MNRVAISKLLGAVVRAPDGRRLGTIREVSLDHDSGQADTVYLSIPLAVGGHGAVCIPWSQFHIRADRAGDQALDIRLPVRLETLRRFAHRES